MRQVCHPSRIARGLILRKRFQPGFLRDECGPRPARIVRVERRGRIPAQVNLSAGDDLRRFLSRRIACPHTVSDLMQEAFLKLMGRQPAAEIRDPRGYLFRIASNLAINHGTRRRDLDALSSEPDSGPAADRSLRDDRTPERVVAGADRLRRVMEAIES
ncbi:MAG: hypothetical protein HUU04_06550, partial [Verrucomicrobiae bacterium]|nr:hypothetical protein [Verrucomicrobiae bacterium]